MSRGWSELRLQKCCSLWQQLYWFYRNTLLSHLDMSHWMREVRLLTFGDVSNPTLPEDHSVFQYQLQWWLNFFRGLEIMPRCPPSSDGTRPHVGNIVRLPIDFKRRRRCSRSLLWSLWSRIQLLSPSCRWWKKKVSRDRNLALDHEFKCFRL